ncbi:uncharacterized protein OGAPODRAFT_17027 [Ogataea polymorpha]|uniref:Uncharacterized protein n=1 Tax=Ogataea polymorpha TaxID=460523 RepID=A0A1B7SFR2_9ASCO|nr:uncharacterized protein OGAPODRAFT_17027 [Ogataea polymorpha]KAG7931095.1 hypothetical protein KL934_004216 [Ogataea polymorpha]KAH3665327.1 hypothetical protein OGATHE_004143 [Ogataea polymorpha]OBA15312.1 hypothetical protein OGAPODRAFT_17027 [Ogataea polymorpha]
MTQENKEGSVRDLVGQDQFESPGVSNGDVDWLFRGKAAKKLSRKSNNISKDVQNQIQQAQLQAAQHNHQPLSTENSDGSLSVSPQPVPQLKPSLKTAPSGSSSFSDSTAKPSESHVSSGPGSHGRSGSNRSRSGSLSSFVPRVRSMSDSKDKSPLSTGPKKQSLFSSLSSKFKSQSSDTASGAVQDPGKDAGEEDFKRVASRKASDSSSRRPSVVEPQRPIESVDAAKQHLENIHFKRVTFSLQDLPDDPQQQIPSRRPRRGNVLIPEDLSLPPPKLSIGITDNLNNQTKDEPRKVDENLLRQAMERHQAALVESRKHAQEAHQAALRIAKEVNSYKKHYKLAKDRDDEDDEDDWEARKYDELRKGLDIDTPLHQHVNYFGEEAEDHTDEHPEELSEAQKNKTNDELPLDLLYTRCCHLREILPIPATLKQLKQKTRPLHVLKMLNPKPTLIDVLSFSDFLAIAPIMTVIFDNVTLDNQMVKIILVSLSKSTTLEKLSFRNVAFDKQGWTWICKFLTVNKSISKLDLSQQRIKPETPIQFYRSEMDWDLFTQSLIIKGGIEELVINGCKLSTAQFKNLVNNGLRLKTRRLGLASTNLDVDKVGILAEWISSPDNTCIGIDIAVNDLTSQVLAPFEKVFATKMDNVKLFFFSLNQTNVTVDDCAKLIELLSTCKTLRFLDLGNNPQLFPGILPTLTEYLPKFPDLRRIHFEFCNLSEAAIIQLCLTFQKCPKLLHVSLLGNENINQRTAASLYISVKNSNIYNLDIDYDGLGDEVSSKIAFYLMRNMEKFLNKDLTHSREEEEDLIFDGSLLTKTAEALLESNQAKNADENQIISNALVEKTVRLRSEIHKTMNRLFEARANGKLSLEGKETLLRFCLLDDSLESIIHIFSEQEHKSEDTDKKATLPDAPGVLTRPELIKKLSSHRASQKLPMHCSSSDVIVAGPIVSPNQVAFEPVNGPISEDAAPHSVVVDANSQPIDHLTGKPVLMRSGSQTSIHAKELEEEEGEFHKWGFFVQKHDSDAPLPIPIEKTQDKPQLKVSNIPSGTELRQAVMKAKGIESVSDLINKINVDSSKLSLIYEPSSDTEQQGNHNDAQTSSAVPSIAVSPQTTANATPVATVKPRSETSISEQEEPQSPVSVNSMDAYFVQDHEAEEIYEKLLDNVAKVRSNRSTASER